MATPTPDAFVSSLRLLMSFISTTCSSSASKSGARSARDREWARCEVPDMYSSFARSSNAIDSKASASASATPRTDS